MPVNSTFGLGHLLIDPPQRAPGPVMAVLGVGDPVRGAAGFFAAGLWPGLGGDQGVGGRLLRRLVAALAPHKPPGQQTPRSLVAPPPDQSPMDEKTRATPHRITTYQYRHDRARRTLRGIDEQVAKAERAVDGHAPVKRNRYIQLTGATKSVNRTLEAKARALAGWKGYTTNLVSQPATFVIEAYHQLWRIEKAFRMSKHDLQARPIYHRTRDSIEAHLSVVFAAMAVSHWIEHQTGWSIKKFVRTARRYRTVTIQAGKHTLTAAEPPPPDLAEILANIHSLRAH